MEKKSYRKEKGKKWFHPDLNRGPSLRESDVITNYTMKPSTREWKVSVMWKEKRLVCVA